MEDLNHGGKTGRAHKVILMGRKTCGLNGIVDVLAFDVNEMIKNLARTFEGQCKKKRLVIQLVFSAKEIFVTADRDKIAQVLYNLVDNAIKFSHADAVIRITVEEKGRKALVAVKDTGFGIPKDELTKIVNNSIDNKCCKY